MKLVIRLTIRSDYHINQKHSLLHHNLRNISVINTILVFYEFIFTCNRFENTVLINDSENSLDFLKVSERSVHCTGHGFQKDSSPLCGPSCLENVELYSQHSSSSIEISFTTIWINEWAMKNLWSQDRERKFSIQKWPFYLEVNTERTIKQACTMCPVGNISHASQVSYEQGSKS